MDVGRRKECHMTSQNPTQTAAEIQQLQETYTYKVNAAQERGDDALTAEIADDYMTRALSDRLAR